MNQNLKIKPKNAKLFVLFGPAGVGKTTLMKLACQRLGANFLQKIVTYTTRKIRAGEQDGFDYVFVEEAKFLELKNQGFFFETSFFNGNFYGSPLNQFKKLEQGQNLIISVELGGVKAFLQIPDTVFIKITADAQSLQNRIKNRDFKCEIEQSASDARFQVDKDQEKDSLDLVFHYSLINQDLQICLNQLLEIIKEIEN